MTSNQKNKYNLHRSVKCDKHHNINKEDEIQHIEWQKDVDPGSQWCNSCIPYLLLWCRWVWSFITGLVQASVHHLTVWVMKQADRLRCTQH